MGDINKRDFGSNMADVFISYAKADNENGREISNFENKLRNTPSKINPDLNIDVWFDEANIRPSEHWADEIQIGIEKAHTVAIFISPKYFASKVCNQELVMARDLGKKLIPIWLGTKPVTDQEIEEAIKDRESGGGDTPELAEAIKNRDSIASAQALQYGKDESLHRQKTFDALVNAIFENAKLDDGATEWLERALAYERDMGSWLNGSDLTEAEKWLVEADHAPLFKVADTTRNFIYMSRTQSQKRQRRLLSGVAGALVVMTFLAILSFFLFQDSQINLETSERLGTAEANALDLSQKRGTQVSIERDNANAERLYTEANLLALQDKGLVETSILLALASHNRKPSSRTQDFLVDLLPRLGTVSTQSYDSLSDISTDAQALDMNFDNLHVAFSTKKGHVAIIDYATQNILADQKLHESKVTDIKFIGDTRVATREQNGTVILWNYITDEIETYEAPRDLNDATVQIDVSPDRRWLAIGGDRDVTILNLETSEQTSYRNEITRGTIGEVVFSPDGKYLLMVENFVGEEEGTRATETGSIQNSRLHLWSVPDFEPMLKQEGALFTVGATFIPNPDRVITSDISGSLLEWNLISNEIKTLRTLTDNGGVLSYPQLEYSPQQHKILINTLEEERSYFEVLDADTYERTQILTGTAYQMASHFLPDGNTFISSEQGGIIREWALGGISLTDGQIIDVPGWDKGAAIAPIPSIGKNLVILAKTEAIINYFIEDVPESPENEVLIMDIHSGEIVQDISSAKINMFNSSPYQGGLVHFDDNIVSFLDLADGSTTEWIRSDEGFIYNVGLYDKYIIVTKSSKKVNPSAFFTINVSYSHHVYSRDTLQELYVLGEDIEPSKSIYVNAKETLFGATTQAGIAIYDIETGTPQYLRDKGSSRKIIGIAKDGEASHLIIGLETDSGDSIEIWDMNTRLITYSYDIVDEKENSTIYHKFSLHQGNLLGAHRQADIIKTHYVNLLTGDAIEHRFRFDDPSIEYMGDTFIAVSTGNSTLQLMNVINGEMYGEMLGNALVVWENPFEFPILGDPQNQQPSRPYLANSAIMTDEVSLVDLREGKAFRKLEVERGTNLADSDDVNISFTFSFISSEMTYMVTNNVVMDMSTGMKLMSQGGGELDPSQAEDVIDRIVPQIWIIDQIALACDLLVRDFTPEERELYNILDDEPTCSKFSIDT